MRGTVDIAVRNSSSRLYKLFARALNLTENVFLILF